MGKQNIMVIGIVECILFDFSIENIIESYQILNNYKIW